MTDCPACQTLVRKLGDAGDSMVARLRRLAADSPYCTRSDCDVGASPTREMEEIPKLAISLQKQGVVKF